MSEGEREGGVESVWAVGVARGADGMLQAVMRTPEGVEVLEPLDALHARGLPSLQPHHRPIETSFATWKKAEFNEYAQSLGAAAGDAQHDVWSFDARGLKYFVPALALMRAVFRPQLRVLPKLFQPQGLDEICSVSDGRVAFNLHHESRNSPHTQASNVEPYQWLHSFPSARRVATSVYTHGRDGRLALDLPLASAKLHVFGMAVSKNFLVTEVRIRLVEALEAPMAHAQGLATRSFYFMASGRITAAHRSQDRKVVTAGAELLPLRDGHSSVSDAEWALLKPTLGAAVQGPRVHDRRAMLDGILAKLCTGRQWRAVDYTVGNYVNAARQYASWQSSGKWDAVLEVIAARGAAAVSDLEQGVTSAANHLVATLHTLSEAEWLALLADCPKPRPHRIYDFRDTVAAVLKHELTGEAWAVDAHVGAGFEHTALRQHSRWRKGGVLPRMVASLGAIALARDEASAG